MTFREKIKARREELRLSQKDVAERAGISVAYVSALETGWKLPPPPPVTRALARALELDEEELLKLAAEEREKRAVEKIRLAGFLPEQRALVKGVFKLTLEDPQLPIPLIGVGFFFAKGISDAFLLTCSHVIARSELVRTLWIELDGRKLRTELITSPRLREHDIAILRVEGEVIEGSFLEFGDPSSIEEGKQILFYGPLEGGNIGLKEGKITVVEEAEGPQGEEMETYLSTNIPISRGASGSPLLIDNKVVAVTIGLTEQGLACGMVLDEDVQAEIKRLLKFFSYSAEDLGLHLVEDPELRNDFATFLINLDYLDERTDRLFASLVSHPDVQVRYIIGEILARMILHCPERLHLLTKYAQTPVAIKTIARAYSKLAEREPSLVIRHLGWLLEVAFKEAEKAKHSPSNAERYEAVTILLYLSRVFGKLRTQPEGVMALKRLLQGNELCKALAAGAAVFTVDEENPPWDYLKLGELTPYTLTQPPSQELLKLLGSLAPIDSEEVQKALHDAEETLKAKYPEAFKEYLHWKRKRPAKLLPLRRLKGIGIGQGIAIGRIFHLTPELLRTPGELPPLVDKILLLEEPIMLPGYLLTHCRGIICRVGTERSHLALFLHSYDKPGIFGLKEKIEELPEGAWVLLNASEGTITLAESGQAA